MNSRELARVENGEQFASVHRDESGRPVFTTKVVRRREFILTLCLDEEEDELFDILRRNVGNVVPDPRSFYFMDYDVLEQWRSEIFDDFMLQIAQNDIELYLYIISNEIKNLILEYEVYNNVESEEKYTVEQFDFTVTNFFRSQRFTLDKHGQYKRQIAERLILAQDEIHELAAKARKGSR